MKPTKEKMIEFLKSNKKNKIKIWNRWRRMNYYKIDMSWANMSGADMSWANMSRANMSGANMSRANIDFTNIFSCKWLSAKFDKVHIIQMLYHAAMPCQNNKLDLDQDIIDLFNSDSFKKIVNRFHRVDECGKFTGVKND